MLLESRLAELVADGNRRDAGELATAALKNDEVVDVSVGSDTVEVETQRFRGVHDVHRDGSQASVVQQGEYEVKGDLSFTFTTATMHDDALDAARDQLRGTDDQDDADDGADERSAAPADDPDVPDAVAEGAARATDGGSQPQKPDDGALGRLADRVRSFLG